MTRPAAKGKTMWPALVAAMALLLTAPQTFASRIASARPDLLARPVQEHAAQDLAPTYTPRGFQLLATTDPHLRQLALFPGHEPPPASAAGEKLASGVARWEPRANLQRIQAVVAETWWVREHLGPVDSPNLYQAFGLDPQNNVDPFGTDDIEPPVTSVEELNARNRIKTGAFKALVRMDQAGRMMLSCPTCFLASAIEHVQSRVRQGVAHGAPAGEVAVVLGADMTGLTDLTQAATGHEAYGGPLSLDERFEQTGSGTFNLGVFTLSVAGTVSAVRGAITPRPAPRSPVVSFTTDETGLTVRAEGRITGPHPGRGKGYRPEPLGGRAPGEHRGHLIPEGGVDDPALVNVRPNIISETPASNLGPKKVLDNLASRLGAENPNSVVRVVAEPLRRPGVSRPFAVTYSIEIDDVVVHAETILNQ